MNEYGAIPRDCHRTTTKPCAGRPAPRARGPAVPGRRRGPAATAYREFHRAAAEDAVRIREVIRHLEQAVRLSRDGFTEQELDVMAQLRSIPVDIDSEVDKLSTPNPATTGPAHPRSSLDSF